MEAPKGYLRRIPGTLQVWAPTLLVAVALIVFLSTIASTNISFRELLSGTADASVRTILYEIRLPRSICAALVGMALTAGGICLQGILRNPLAEPYLAGVSAGAGVGATVAAVLGFETALGGFGGVLLSFIGAILCTMLVVRLAQRHGTLSVSKFLLAGVAVGAFLWALIYAILLLDQQTLDRILVWLLGSFQLADWQAVWLLGPLVLLPLPLAFSRANSLNAMSLGDEQAAHLGVDTQKAKLQIILLVALMTGAAVSVCGLIGFVGLIVPHMARRLFGADHRLLLPLGTLLGSAFLVLCDLAARSLLPPREIPIGILTALLGAPFFLSLLRRSP